MQKKNLIWIIGGAAVVGYFLFMRRKKSIEIPQEIPQASTPDQQLAPAFVNRSVIPTALRSRRAKRNLTAPILSESNVLMPASIEPASAMQEVAQDMMMKPVVLTAREARSSARDIRQDIRAGGGTRKEARQAARTVRRDARQTRRLGDLPVTF
jgi:hypothetical protein